MAVELLPMDLCCTETATWLVPRMWDGSSSEASFEYV
jgi:hypothetical protein